MRMNREKFSRLIAEIEAASDLSEYFAAETAANAGDREAAYSAYVRSIREIVKSTGLSQAKFAQLYNIPQRTVENWCVGKRACPLYTRLMLQEAAGLIQLENSHPAE